MKSLPEIDLKEKYKTEFKSDNLDYKENLCELIKRLEKEDNPSRFRNYFLAATQLYFDGIIDMKSKPVPQKKKLWSRQKEILDKLCLSGKKAMGSFYRGEGINFEVVKEIFLPYASDIIKYGSEEKAKKRHLGDYYNVNVIQKFGQALTLKPVLNNLSNKKNPFDSLICVASGGFEPSFLAMDITGKKSLTPVRYSIISGGRNDQEVKIPKMAPEDYIVQEVKGKNVLIIEDWASTGTSLSKVMEYSAQMNPSELYGVAVKGYIISLPYLKTKLINEIGTIIYKYERLLEYERLL